MGDISQKAIIAIVAIGLCAGIVLFVLWLLMAGIEWLDDLVERMLTRWRTKK